MQLPAAFHLAQIRLAEAAIRSDLRRRLADPSSAAYMRACIRHAIAAIRRHRAELARA